jgi:hypothetical protein
LFFLFFELHSTTETPTCATKVSLTTGLHAISQLTGLYFALDKHVGLDFLMQLCLPQMN